MKKEDAEQAAQQYAEGPECTWVGTTALEIAFLAGAKWDRNRILAIIKSRISEVIGDAQPKPALRAELEELITRIKNEN